MSGWSSLSQHQARPTHHQHHRQQQHNSPPFGRHKDNSFRYHNNAGPFSTSVVDQVDECCSYFGKLLIEEPSSSQHRYSHRTVGQDKYQHQYQQESSQQANFGASSKSSTMTIGHHHHYGNRHHYPYHDHYHDDSPMLPRLEFPSSQFDRLLRSSPNLDRSSDTSGSSGNTSVNRYTSSVRDSSSSSNSHSTSSASSSNHSRHSSWKTGPFDSRRK